MLRVNRGVLRVEEKRYECKESTKSDHTAIVSGKRVLRLNSRTLRVERQVLQDMTNMSG